MTDYEIRILRSEDRSEVNITARVMGDYAAVRRARMLAGLFDRVEVWREDVCVYARDCGLAAVS